ncbi:MAG: hypothetical protein Q9182_001035 [Xanthomendoza sp. 2 TL-2023]
MASEHVLRLLRTDSPAEYVLLHTCSNGSSPLDLQLLATEGTEPYIKTLKHSRISKYRAKSNHLSDSQWETLLRSTFLHESSPKDGASTISTSRNDDEMLKGVELVASITNTKLTITLRKSISGIHQKLGEFSLSSDPNQSINILDWASTAVLRAENLVSQSLALQQKLAEQTALAQSLNQQLEELIKAKKEHEDSLLEKCALLINEKKAKIRDQQRLLVIAKPDPKKLKEVQSARQPSTLPHRSPKASGKGKRKASAPVSSDEEVDGFEDGKMKIEEKEVEEEQQPDSEDVTPGQSDLDETEDEVDGGDAEPVPAPPTAKGKIMEKAEVKGGVGGGSGALGDDEELELPPRRGLPFRMEKADDTSAVGGGDGGGDTKMVDNDDDETDDDDEL